MGRIDEVNAPDTDWQGFYFNGVLFYQHHSYPSEALKALVRTLKLSYTYHEKRFPPEEDGAGYPEHLEDVLKWPDFNDSL